MACSTTPRTTRKYLDELAALCERVQRDDVIYAEVKECMASGDVAAALTLLDLLPEDFRNVAAYRRQCRTYDALCRTGVVERTGLTEVRASLARILCEDSSSPALVRYADGLVRNGFNAATVASVTMYTMEEAMDAAGMSDGHRQLFSAHAEWNTPFAARTWVQLLLSLHRCAPLLACVKSTVTKRTKRRDVPAEEEQEERDATRTTDEDATATHAERSLARWKTAATVAELFDDEETVGDDE